MALLDDTEIQAIASAAVASGLGDPAVRGQLLGGMNAQFRAAQIRTLTTSELVQTLSDLRALNRVDRLADDSVPLRDWLEMAVQLAGGTAEGDRFSETLVRVRERLEAAPQDRPAAVPVVAAATPQASRSLRLFYSYAHEDESYREQLEKHLAALRHEGTLTEWHDRRILAGADWREAIDAELRAADMIVLLVSPDFLASRFIYEQELRAALARHDAATARVIPVIVRPVDWRHTPIGALQALPRDGRPVSSWRDRDTAWADVAAGIRAVAGDLVAGRTH